MSVHNLLFSGRQYFCLSKMPWNENCQNAHCLSPCRARASCNPLPLVVSISFLKPFFVFSFAVICDQNAKPLSSPLSLNRLPCLSFQPVFSLGSLPGKQAKHLNQWKICLMVLRCTAPLCCNYAKE